MRAVTCEHCGRRFRLSSGEARLCLCGHPVVMLRGVRRRLLDALLFGIGFSVVAALIPLLGIFDWRWEYGWTRQAFLGAVLSYTPARALVGLGLGAVVGWFNDGLALRIFDWFTEKPRS
ncbi:MAG: hypothetical protein NVSMB9_08970 [Isosphaeraceae bacterium]